jgi:beta-glucanase (GH16 family)
LVWSDEFNGTTLDETKWNYEIGDGCSYNLCGFGNSELQSYQRNNVVVSNGILKIIAKQERVGNSNYTSARIRTNNKGDFKYGRFEARMKLPKDQGIWPAFWMLPTDEAYGGWPQSGEIDIMELIGREPSTSYGTIHFGKPFPNNRSTGANYVLQSGVFNDDFHVFALEWEPNVMRWYIDDYLYATKTTTNVSPERWPFDQRFHILLNLAVGGNWPGSPNSSTGFPQTMEVDYVRVYDGNAPSITGPRNIAFNAPQQSYTIGAVALNTKVNWTVPAGATVMWGQGTPDVLIDLGNKGGIIQAEVTTPCGVKVYKVSVAVAPDFSRDFSLKNFDQASVLKLNYTTGQLTENSANPAKNAVNGSNLCAKYFRAGSSQYDLIIYEGAAVPDLNVFVRKEKKFYIDINTDAPVGTTILLQFENSNRALPNNYPTGRHSRFQAVTTKRNEWERIELPFLDQPDGATAGTSINRVVILFNPNTYSSNTYYFDNLDVFAVVVTAVKDILPNPETIFKIYPNPVGDFLTLENKGDKTIQSVVVYGIDGQVLLQRKLNLNSKEQTQLELKGIPTGTLMIKALLEDGKAAIQQMIKN